jgi:hypothetical protein
LTGATSKSPRIEVQPADAAIATTMSRTSKEMRRAMAAVYSEFGA